MTLDIVRRIRGNLHGSIDVTRLEDKVILHPYFQRLRRIRQTAFLSYVFPGATHTRFEHSLGVMHLAGVAWNKIKDNQERMKRSSLAYKNFSAMERSGTPQHGLLSPTFEVAEEVFQSDATLQTLRLAALLHDVGHPPFSHSGERFLPSYTTIAEECPDLPDYIADYLSSKIEHLGDQAPKKSVSHEMYTIIMVHRILKDTYKEYPDLQPVIDPRDVVSVINPKIKPQDHSSLIRLGVHKLCHELVSGEIDIDRMDYLQRDSQESGVVYGIFDLGRILDSLLVYYDEKEECLHLAIQYAGLAAFEDYLRARQSMYLQLYFHKTSVACEAMLKHLTNFLGDWSLPPGIEDYAKVDEVSISFLLEKGIKDRIKDGEKRKEALALVEDLLFHRRLWKRVFEISGPSPVLEMHPEIENALKVIDDVGCHFQQVSSTSHLTKFRPRTANGESQNYLRLVKKDSLQFPRVIPIEDQSNLISSNQTVHIQRIYCESSRASDGEKWDVKVKKALIESYKD